MLGVVVGAVGGVGAGARVGAGGGRVAVRAGVAGGARRAGRGFGASTVTCGTVTVGAAPLCGVSGAPCCGCAAGASAGGVCGAGVAGGVSGVVVAGGVSGAGVCEEPTPVKQISMSAELLSKSKRRLRIFITRPPNFRTNHPAGGRAKSNNVTLPTIGPDSRFGRPVAETQHCLRGAARSCKPHAPAAVRGGVSAGTSAPAR